MYTTIGARALRHLAARVPPDAAGGARLHGRVAPTMWDVDFRTAVAQAEFEDREIDGLYHRVAFDRDDGAGTVEIETSRPELIPACVALVAHPDDERYASLVGSTVRTPLFRVPVPVVAHELADPEKGTGIAMICTFGDVTDVTWWRELGLPTRVVIRRDGTLAPGRFGEPGWESRDPDAANAAMAELRGKAPSRRGGGSPSCSPHVGALVGEPDAGAPRRQVLREGRSAARGDHAAGSGSSRRSASRRRCSSAGRRDRMAPGVHGRGFTSWVEGLNQDWAISRQRYFGVPFPVWYRLDADGEPDYDDPIFADEAACRSIRRSPCRPASTTDQRGKPDGFIGDPDIMDTWATSSLTPADRRGLGGRPRPVRAPVPDGPAAAGARHHPDVALLHGAPRAPRARLDPVDERGDQRVRPRPGPQEDVEVQGQRRRCRPRSSSGTRPTPSGIGRRARGSGSTRRSTSSRSRSAGASRSRSSTPRGSC